MKIGLALGGGAARGIAHIGVLKYLEDQGVKPQYIAATSAGSMVAAFYCAGLTLDRMVKIAHEISWKDMFKISIPRKGLIKSEQVRKIVEEYIGKTTFEQLELPLVINAVDLLKGKEVIFNSGIVSAAVEASCAIPGIFTPVKINSQLLVDGGLLDNIPAVHLKGQGIDLIISVNVSAQKPIKGEPGSIFEVLVQSYDIVRRNRDSKSIVYSDIMIEPDLGDISFWDTGKTDILVQRGYDASRAALEKVNLKKKENIFTGWAKKVKRIRRQQS